MKILCMGDSLTFGFGVPRKQVWTSLAAAELGVEISNRGIPGDTTGGMLARYVVEMEKCRPDLVCLLGGFNDIFFGGSDAPARANIAAMAHQTVARNCKPVICTPVPLQVESAPEAWSRAVDFFASQEIGREYVAWLRTFAACFHIPLVDYWALFEGLLRDKPNEKFYVDGLHPNTVGQQFMANTFITHIRPLLSSKALE